MRRAHRTASRETPQMNCRRKQIALECRSIVCPLCWLGLLEPEQLESKDSMVFCQIRTAGPHLRGRAVLCHNRPIRYCVLTEMYSSRAVAELIIPSGSYPINIIPDAERGNGASAKRDSGSFAPPPTQFYSTSPTSRCDEGWPKPSSSRR